MVNGELIMSQSIFCLQEFYQYWTFAKVFFKYFFIFIFTIFESFYLFDRPLLMRQHDCHNWFLNFINNRKGDTLVQRFIESFQIMTGLNEIHNS